MRHITEARDKLALSSLTNDRFLVLEDMVLETRKGDIRFPMGEEIVLGADANDNLVVADMRKHFIVEDSEIGKEIVNNVVCKEELSDVQYKKMTFVEAKNMRITTPGLIKCVSDTDEIRNALKDAKKRKDALYEMKKEGVALPVLCVEKKMSFKDKASRIMENKITSKAETLLVEAIEITETPAFAKNCLMLDTIRCVMDEAKQEHDNVENADEFINTVNNMEGVDLDMGSEGTDDKMVAKKGELVMGVFDTKSNLGVFFPQGAFASAEELEKALEDNGFELKSKKDLEKLFDADKEEKVEEALEEFVNSKAEDKSSVAKQRLINCGMTDEIAESVINLFK